jgi:hypothetical protein
VSAAAAEARHGSLRPHRAEASTLSALGAALGGGGGGGGGMGDGGGGGEVCAACLPRPLFLLAAAVFLVRGGR